MVHPVKTLGQRMSSALASTSRREKPTRPRGRSTPKGWRTPRRSQTQRGEMRKGRVKAKRVSAEAVKIMRVKSRGARSEVWMSWQGRCAPCLLARPQTPNKLTTPTSTRYFPTDSPTLLACSQLPPFAPLARSLHSRLYFPLAVARASSPPPPLRCRSLKDFRRDVEGKPVRLESRREEHR